MKNPFFTLIVPVYNVEPILLTNCLDSILKNTYKDYEIIVIDDSSNNINTIEWLNKNKNKYNFKLIRNQENIGLGPTRNVGLTQSKGEYIWFIDGDDKIYENSLEKAHDILKNKNFDFLSFNFNYLENNGVVSNKDYKMAINKKELWGVATVWSKIINRNFLIKNDIRHLNVKWIHEDEYFTPLLLLYSEKFTSTNDILYEYNCTNNNSLTKSNKNSEIFYWKYIWKFLNKSIDCQLNENIIDYMNKKIDIPFCKEKNIFSLYRKIYIRTFRRFKEKNTISIINFLIMLFSFNFLINKIIFHVAKFILNRIMFIKKMIHATLKKIRKREIVPKYSNFNQEPIIRNKVLFIEHVFKLDYIYNQMELYEYDIFSKNFDDLTVDDLKYISNYEKIIVAEELFDLIPLKKNHNIICIWHGIGALKRISSKIFKNYEAPFNKVIVGSTNIEDYQKWFKLNKENIIPAGSISSSIVLANNTEKNRKKLLKELNISDNKKIYFISFSFQEYPKFGANIFYSLKELEKLLNDDEIIIYNLHPSCYFFNTNKYYYSSQKILHIKNIPSEKLVTICDLYITDYSSSFIFAMLINKPILFLIESFIGYDRGFNKHKNQFPGKVIKSNNPKKIIKEFRKSLFNKHNKNYDIMVKTFIKINEIDLINKIKKIIYNN